jgi:hypothetical protein
MARRAAWKAGRCAKGDNSGEWPKEAITRGRWTPPAVVKVS